MKKDNSLAPLIQDGQLKRAFVWRPAVLVNTLLCLLAVGLVQLLTLSLIPDSKVGALAGPFQASLVPSLWFYSAVALAALAASFAPALLSVTWESAEKSAEGLVFETKLVSAVTVQMVQTSISTAEPSSVPMVNSTDQFLVFISFRAQGLKGEVESRRDSLNSRAIYGRRKQGDKVPVSYLVRYEQPRFSDKPARLSIEVKAIDGVRL